jgi:predicted nucleic acid-binding protein
MAIYVVDASVVVQYAITQTYTPEARVLVTRMYTASDHNWSICHAELRPEQSEGTKAKHLVRF